jgi:S-formylglutathione hydrolase
MMNYHILENHKVFGGKQYRLQHHSSSCKSLMTMSIFVPPQAQDKSVPVVYWLSGLTCTDENFTHKAGAQRKAAELGLIIVMPDSSPRGETIPNDDSYDLGQGAGFYLNATQAPWADHFQMYDYITKDLPNVVKEFLVESQYYEFAKQGIFGHSMGGHGALTIGLSNPSTFSSISAFAPITNPSQCPWGQKAFKAYLGDDQSTWEKYDALELIKRVGDVSQTPILIDQGDADQFLAEQLNFDSFKRYCETQNYPVTCRLQNGYDHSYFFIASFINEHLEFHYNLLRK